MKKANILVAAILVLGLAVASLVGGCAPAGTSKLKVVTSTSLIASLVERVGGNRVDVVNIIPPAQCPGHFDVKPGDIQRLADADLFFLHGWQGEMFSEELIASANNPDLTVVTVDIEGLGSDWMIPSGQLAATDKITDALCQVDAENSAAYQESATEYKDKIAAKEAEIEAKLNQVNPSGVNVMCAEMQAGFVKWVGFNIITTYDRNDPSIPQVVRELVDTGREAGVTLVIDNLQSGQDAGLPIAMDIGCRRIILSNFPGGFDNTETWEKAIDRNIELILEAIAQ
jgi:zinc transport system substrate-binding protein